MLLQGILLGLSLSILVGPLIFALIDASIRQGFRAGIAVGAGIWISDWLFILGTYFGLKYINRLVDWPGFGPTLGIVGGIVLLLFGGGTLWGATKFRTAKQALRLAPRQSYFRWALKGFLINTLNPFTVFFWTGVAGTVISRPGFRPVDALLFYGGVLGMIILTDTLKVGLAKLIRERLTELFIQRLRQVSGAALMIFGLVLIIRTIWFW